MLWRHIWLMLLLEFCDLWLCPLKDSWATPGAGICIPGFTGLTHSALPGLCRVWWWLVGHSPCDYLWAWRWREKRERWNCSFLLVALITLASGNLRTKYWNFALLWVNWPVWDDSGYGETWAPISLCLIQNRGLKHIHIWDWWNWGVSSMY